MKRGVNFYELLFCVFLLLKLGFEYYMSWFEVFFPLIMMFIDMAFFAFVNIAKLDIKARNWILKKYMAIVVYFATRSAMKIVKKNIRNAGGK